MEKVYSLKNEYVKVAKTSFGGSQTFFRGSSKKQDCRKEKGGCGLVAITDVMSYLNNDTDVISSDDYIKRFNSTVRKALWIPSRFGMHFIHLTLAMKKRLKTSRLDLNAKWCFSKKKLYPRIRQMLQNNIPVILNIPKKLGRKSKIKKLNLYNENMTVFDTVHSHYVVITGITKENSVVFLEISSWGRKLYISYPEYRAFCRSTITGILGNILYISSK